MKNTTTLTLHRFIPLLIVVLLMGIAYFTGLINYLSLESLKQNQHAFKNIVEVYPVLAGCAYVLLDAVATALSIPVGLILSLFAGLLFPQPFSTLIMACGGTLGAGCLFLAARSAVGNLLRQRAGPFLINMERGFHENAASYMLFLRLVPIFPFWLVNLAPAFFRIPFFTFIWTTFIGIIPIAFIITQAGAGLGQIVNSSSDLNLHSIFNTDVKIALLGLGIFSIVPIALRNYIKIK
jgi:uncharacterized membrane protein YdjX (TVP38/TMEM64 family)